MPTMLIDGDLLLYQVAVAVEEPIHWGNDWWSLTADFKQAQQMLQNRIEEWETRTECDQNLVALSDPSHNWRKDIYEPYKGNRKGKRKPVVYNPLREWLESEYQTACFSNLEADDVLGILQTDRTIIASDDKDMMSIPGWLYQPMHDKITWIDKEEADRNHLIQALSGDRTDNYPGCPKVGPVTARKILEENTWDEVVGAYEKAGLSEEVALTQARVARILRVTEWNAITEEVQLWSPE